MSDKPKLQEILQNPQPVVLETLKVIKNRESMKSCPSQEQPKKILQLHVT